MNSPSELSRRTLLAALAAGTAGALPAWGEGSAGRGTDPPTPPVSTANGDEDAVPHLASVHTKGLPHDDAGLVDRRAWQELKSALDRGEPARFETIPLGGPRRLANPLAAFAQPVLGPSTTAYELPPAPRFAGGEQAAELVELYWLALLRDVPFAAWNDDESVQAACRELGALRGYRGPRPSGHLTPRALGCGDFAGDLRGPRVSQFLLKDMTLRPVSAPQRFRGLATGVDHATDRDSWHRLIVGQLPGPDRFDDELRYPRDGRGLATTCRRDLTYQAFFCAASTLLAWGSPIDGGNPYKHSRTQAGFATWGAASILNLLAFAADAAFAACWHQKWRVHRRARPEEYAGKLEMVRLGRLELPFPSEVLDSEAAARLLARQGNVFLPQAYSEGSPLHPSYPAGHAVVAGAGATILKAFLDEAWIIPEPVVARADGKELEPWTGESLDVGGELDKLASNLAFGRGWAGIHWRSDTEQGLRLGERVAHKVLAAMREHQPEQLGAVSYRAFDGDRRTA